MTSHPTGGAWRRALAKHERELTRLFEPERMRLLPRVELALALMRLSCEPYGVLLSLFVAYLLFREPPAGARFMIYVNSCVSQFIQTVRGRRRYSLAFPSLPGFVGACS